MRAWRRQGGDVEPRPASTSSWIPWPVSSTESPPEVPLAVSRNIAQYPVTNITGGGTKAVGDCLNSKGLAVIYRSTSVVLAVLETLAYIGGDIAARNRFLIRIEEPDAVWNKRAILDPASLARLGYPNRRAWY